LKAREAELKRQRAEYLKLLEAQQARLTQSKERELNVTAEKKVVRLDDRQFPSQSVAARWPNISVLRGRIAAGVG
jgi:hypothetical protein